MSNEPSWAAWLLARRYINPDHPDDGFAYHFCICDGCEDLRERAGLLDEELEELDLP